MEAINIYNVLDTDEEESEGVLNQPAMSARDNLLCGLYTLIPPRRAEDMSLLTLVETLDNQPPNTNYITLESNERPAVVFNVYKKSCVRGPVKIFLPASLIELASIYIKEKNIKFGDRLFKGSANTFGKSVTRAFKKKYNIAMSINTMRHFAATQFYSNSALTLYQREHVARQMGHGLYMNMKYARVSAKTVPPF
jgi:hypothetical protein